MPSLPEKSEYRLNITNQLTCNIKHDKSITDNLIIGNTFFIWVDCGV
jgi:hypothetical protein